MELILITIGLLGVGFAGIAIKIWAKKDGKFEGTCASNNPIVNPDNNGVCSFCGARRDEQCMKDEVA